MSKFIVHFCGCLRNPNGTCGPHRLHTLTVECDDFRKIPAAINVAGYSKCSGYKWRGIDEGQAGEGAPIVRGS